MKIFTDLSGAISVAANGVPKALTTNYTIIGPGFRNSRLFIHGLSDSMGSSTYRDRLPLTLVITSGSTLLMTLRILKNG
jgi:hypothetical protein